MMYLFLKTVPENFRTVEEELFLLGGAVLLGIPVGILFDFFRFLRRLIPHHWFFTALEDIFFLILVSFLLLCYVSTFAGGEFRMYHVIGCLCGFVLHECTLGNLFFSLWDSFARICRKLTRVFVKSDKK
ncbi:MAG: spore cortex biosynthesis protein YabQ [Oscillospiraceae bacterium]|nr:spore cortex biosynthesis protein YabQ [Oscillospiraceae bacterium]